MNNHCQTHDRNRTNRPGWRTQALVAMAAAATFSPKPAGAADLRPETIQAWQEYVTAARARNQTHLDSGCAFLSIDDIPGEAAKLRRGEVVVSPAGPNVPLTVPTGLIHDWIGAIFIPNASLGDAIRVVRDYEQYYSVYRPGGYKFQAAGSERMDRPVFHGVNEQVVLREAHIPQRLPLDFHAYG